MKMIIDFDQETNVFTVQFDRGAIPASDGGDWPPPPPWSNQLEAMTNWLNKTYPDITKKFIDHEVSGLKLTFQAPDPIK